ncbi:MAG: hypothetical protein AAB263_22295 [Planctomycetota bacterium]
MKREAEQEQEPQRLALAWRAVLLELVPQPLMLRPPPLLAQEF